MKTIYYKFFYKNYIIVFLQLGYFYFSQIGQCNAQTYHWVKVIIVVNLFIKITTILFTLLLIEWKNHVFQQEILFKTHNMAWNIQIAEICSVIFDVHAQFAFKAAHGYAFIFIYFLVQQSHWFKNWHFLYQKLCASSASSNSSKTQWLSLNTIKCWVSDFKVLRNAIYAFTLISKKKLSKINKWNF